MRSDVAKISIALLIVIAVCLLGLAGWFYESSQAMLQLREAEAALSREVEASTPLGADRTQVQRFLADRKISHGAYEELDREGEDLYSDKELTNGATAIIDAHSDFRRMAILDCQIHLVFRFDQFGKLRGYSHKPVCNGPF